MVPHFFPGAQDKDIVDMDTKERIRYMSESSMSGTSGYSTTSPGPGNSPISSGYSSEQSPASMLHSDFVTLTLPQTTNYHQQSPHYLQFQTLSMNPQTTYNSNNNIGFPYSFGGNMPQSTAMQVNYTNTSATQYPNLNRDYPAKLSITEQPVEKFRFRYKSEMHGTHGSLTGTTSNRSTKSFPEVELCNYSGPAIIRCSLFQTNRDSPHSHQLVVRQDEHDICDPHELKVSQELGYFAEFKNMGIIHTAKKFIVDELLKKRRKRLQFELGRDELTTKEEQELHKQTEKEAKDMNLNQVRLCFEAFRLEGNNLYTPIAAPVYSNAINNRKSAQTGELRITRLSIVTGCVTGGQDLILLVEKVSKKNIKVRFYELNDDELVWEAFATFRESDVHHQYAISCRTPPYKDKDIDKSVEVYIELVRPSDDERSYPPSSFRYKPREQVYLRKRKRTSSIDSASSGGTFSSGDIPKTVQEQQIQQQQSSGLFAKILSEELDKLLANPEYKQKIKEYSEEGTYTDILNFIEADNARCGITGQTEKDGVPATSEKLLHYKKIMISKKLMDNARQLQKASTSQSNPGGYIQKISEIFNSSKNCPSISEQYDIASKQIVKLYKEYSEKHGESLMHEMVINDNIKYAMSLCHILRHFKLEYLFNGILNTRGQTPLHCACLLDRPQYIRPLLNLGCKANIPDAEGDTALHIVVREANTECLDCFINTNKELQLNILNDEGFIPLHIAVRDNNTEIAAKLIKLDKTTVIVPNSTDGNNALHIAVQQQNVEMVKIILESQPTISLLSTSNTAGYTPVDLAKQIAPTNKKAGQILNMLLMFKNTTAPSSDPTVMPFSDLDDNCSNLVIKEEEQFSSSTEDDDDDSIEPAQIVNCKADDTYRMDTPIKEEQDKDEYLSAVDLEAALEDHEIYTKLSKAFASNPCWKQKLDIPDYYLTDPSFMLNYVKRNVKTINCQSFALVIQEIDKTLLDLIRK